MKALTEKEIEYLFRNSGFNGSNHLNYMNTSVNNKSKCIVANYYKGIPYNVLFEKVGELNEQHN